MILKNLCIILPHNWHNFRTLGTNLKEGGKKSIRDTPFEAWTLPQSVGEKPLSEDLLTYVMATAFFKFYKL